MQSTSTTYLLVEILGFQHYFSLFLTHSDKTVNPLTVAMKSRSNSQEVVTKDVAVTKIEEEEVMEEVTEEDSRAEAAMMVPEETSEETDQEAVSTAEKRDT